MSDKPEDKKEGSSSAAKSPDSDRVVQLLGATMAKVNQLTQVVQSQNQTIETLQAGKTAPEQVDVDTSGEDIESMPRDKFLAHITKRFEGMLDPIKKSLEEISSWF